MARTTIVTGQYVPISQELASIGDRLVANFIDFSIIGIYSWCVFMLILLYDLNLSNEEKSIVMFFVAVPPIVYHLVFEILLNGRTLGKMIMKIQVNMLDGTTPTVNAYFLRWTLLPLDLMGAGMLSVLFTRNSQRLGDLAAGTVVCKKHDPSKVSYTLNNNTFVSHDYVPTYPEAANLTSNQIELISRTFYNQMPNRDEMVHRLALKIQEHLGVDDMGMDAQTFISVISNDYYYYASNIEV